MNKTIQHTKQANYTLILLCLAYLFDYADRMVVSSLLPFIKAEWMVSDKHLGMLTGIVSLLIALFVIPSAFFVDKWSRKHMLAIMVFLWSMATLGAMFAQNYSQLLLARAFTGLGEAGYATASIAMIVALFPEKSRAKYIGIWDAFAPLGAGIGFILGGYIGLHYGWRHALGILAVPGIILAVQFLFVKDYKTVREEKAQGMWQEFLSSLSKLKGKKSLWIVYAAFALNIAVNTSMMTWVPSYFHRYFDLSEKEAGFISGGIALLALIGAPLGGFIADKLRKRNINSRLEVSAITSFLSGSFLLIGFSLSSFPLVMISLVGFGITAVAYLAPASAAIQDVVHPGVRAMAFAVNVVLMNVFGAFTMPVLVGKISDHVGLNKALFILPFLSILAGFTFLRARKHYQKDCEKVKSVDVEFN